MHFYLTINLSEHLPSLVWLKMRYKRSKFDRLDDNAASLFASLPSLTRLDLRDESVAVTGAQMLLKNPKLLWIDLDNTPANDNPKIREEITTRKNRYLSNIINFYNKIYWLLK